MNTRAKGMRFEAKVRKDLESRGFIVSKWQNNVDLNEGKLVPARQGKYRLTSTGFPDFISYMKLKNVAVYIFGVECKVRGYLTKKEKEKCKWLIQNNIFDEIFIAKKDRNQIAYERWDAKKRKKEKIKKN